MRCFEKYLRIIEASGSRKLEDVGAIGAGNGV